MDPLEVPDQAHVDAAIRTLARVWALAMAEAVRPLLGTRPVDERLPVRAGERDLPVTISVAEAATLLGLSRAGAYEAVRRGDVPSLRIGRRILIPTSKLKEMLGA